MALQTQVREVIVSALGESGDLSALTYESPLFAPLEGNGAGLDSLSSLEILAALSHRFSLPMDDISSGDMRSISSLVRYLETKGIRDSSC